MAGDLRGCAAAAILAATLAAAPASAQKPGDILKVYLFDKPGEVWGLTENRYSVRFAHSTITAPSWQSTARPAAGCFSEPRAAFEADPQ